MTEVAVREGYGGASVARTIAHAGVSRPTFYEHFENKDDCFLAAHAAASELLREEILQAVERERPERALQAVLRALGAFAASQPTGARFLMEEIMAGGPRALDARDTEVVEIAAIVERAFTRLSPDTPTPDLPTSAVIGALYRLLSQSLRRNETNLEHLLDSLDVWLDSHAQPTAKHLKRTPTPPVPFPPPPRVSELSLQAPVALGPGRPSQSEQEVSANHRERLLYATAEVGAQKGFTATTIADITTAAHVDRRVFYRHFHDKQEIFLAAHELAFQQTLAVTAAAFFRGENWPERVWESARAFTQFLATHPVLTNIGFVESNAIGAAAVQRINDTNAAFTIFLQEGYQHPQSINHPSPQALTAIAAMQFEIFYHEFRHGDWTDIPTLLPEITLICLTPFLGPEAAAEFVQSKLA